MQQNRKKLRMRLTKLSIKAIASPLDMIYYRQLMHVYNRQYYGIIDFADGIAVDEGGWALWNGAHASVMEGLCEIVFDKKNNPRFSLGNLLGKVIANTFNYCAMMIKIDQNQQNFNNSMIEVFNYAVERPGRAQIAKGILAISILGIINQILSYQILKTFFSYSRNKNGQLARAVNVLVTGVLMIPLFAIARRVMVEQCTFMEAFQSGNLYEGFSLYLTATFIKNMVRDIITAIWL